MTRGRATLLLVFAVLLWSTSGLLIKLTSLNALALTGGPSAIAALVLLAYLRKPHFTWSAAQVGGALAYFGAQVFFVTATQMTSAANAIILQYTAPIYVAVFGIWYLGEYPKRSDWITMGGIGAGMLLFFSQGLTRAGPIGNLTAIASGICLAWMILLTRKQAGGSPLETFLLGNLLGAIVGLPFLLRSSPMPVDWAILLYLGIFQIGISMIFFSKAIRYLQAIEIALVTSLEPVLNPIWVFMAVGERPSPQALLGGTIVLVSITARAVSTAMGGRFGGARRAGTTVVD